jgi:hypothetical protein
METRAPSRVGGRQTRVPSHLLQAFCDGVQDEKTPPRAIRNAPKVRFKYFYFLREESRSRLAMERRSCLSNRNSNGAMIRIQVDSRPAQPNNVDCTAMLYSSPVLINAAG